MLRDLDVLVLDCQATGATPAHGELLELGWGICGSAGLAAPARAHWIAPRTDRGVSRIVRKLTGWDDTCLEVAVEPARAWGMLAEEASLSRAVVAPLPTVIHFARFELPFLRELHAQAGEPASPFPFDAVCLHAIAQRLYPELPRRNLRALAGHLGFSPELVRRSAGHVAASAFIWHALAPELERRGASTWSELKEWLEVPAPAPASRGRRAKPEYPLAADKRRALPDGPGIYRFLRPNGDVLYVGKAASLKRRVASHFTTVTRATERALEMLSQAHDVRVTTTETTLEAALLETDEIKRLDPPYNVQLRAGDRHAWFASRDWTSASSTRDDEHPVGPLPSRMALSGLAAVHALLETGAAPDDALRGAAVGVPPAFAPPEALFDLAWRDFVATELSGDGTARARLLRAARRIVLVDAEPDAQDDELHEDGPPSRAWDAERVRRYLERTVVLEALLVRRAHALCLLCDSRVAFREPHTQGARLLVIAGGEIVEARELANVTDVQTAPGSRPPSRRVRQAAFDAARYDRMRVLSTELRRVVEQGGEVVVRVGARSTTLQRKGQ